MNDSKQGGMVRKYATRLAGLISAGIIVYSCVLFLNNIWYEFNIPRDFRDAKWEGEFVSAKHPTSGKLLARLPDPIPRDQEFEFELVVYYNIWSFFLTGKTARADFVGYLSGKGPVTAGAETRPSVIPRHFSFSLKGGTTPFPHDIKYTATIDRDDQFVAGSYSAQAAFDVGYFSMKKH
jgi:hypothetical protein